MTKSESIAPSIDSWSIHGPDGQGCVWLEVRTDKIVRINLGPHRDVIDKLADWRAECDA